MTWKTLGTVSPSALSPTRLELHWAAQLVSAPGTTLLSAEADYGHTNLGWDAALCVLSGRSIGTTSLRAGLVFEGLELVVIEGERERSSIRLAGRTLEEARTWLGREMTGGGSGLGLPTHEMPSHPVGEGGAFSGSGGKARTELGAWFANAFAAIREAVASEPSASPVRCWPHHFDVASSIALDQGGDPEERRSIGVGFSPGDGSYDQPYLYVTPWPYPDREDLPPLSEGSRWHRKGWTGMVLLADDLISASPGQQQRSARQALERGIAACRELLGR